ncbi:MAG TPA: type II secretion system F family protein [Stellaceae bacterium]|nr:type II secretion system F family protein [Stellaceae bacterium]
MSPVMMAAVGVMILAMSSLLAFVVMAHTGPRARLKLRIADIAGGVKDTPAARSRGGGPQQRSRSIKTKLAEAGTGNEGEKQSRRVELHLMIERAGLSISIRSFYLASAASAVIGTGLYFLMGYHAISWLFGVLPIPMFLVVPVVMGLGLPRRFLTSRAGKRQKHFTQHFADAIDVIVRGIKSGLPVGECLNIIARESPEPVCSEFKLLVEGQKLGMTLKQALERSCRDMPTADMKFFAIVLNLQQQTGGNLAETLAGLSDVLRQRKKMADKVKAMSSEARMTATIIGSMPFLISLMIYLINPGYISLLWTDPTGQKIFYGGLTWMGIGVFLMKQMISFEI